MATEPLGRGGEVDLEDTLNALMDAEAGHLCGAPNNGQNPPPTWFQKVKRSIVDDAKRKRNVCATGSFAFGAAALWLMENPAVSAVGGVISLGLGAADYFGICPYSF